MTKFIKYNEWLKKHLLGCEVIYLWDKSLGRIIEADHEKNAYLISFEDGIESEQPFKAFQLTENCSKLMHKVFDAYINALKIDEEQKLALQKRLANEQSRIEEEQRIIRIKKQIEDGLNYKLNKPNKLPSEDSKTIDETKNAILEKLKQFFPNFYHLTHKSNFHSILKLGILCWKEAHKAKRNEIDISDPSVQQRRNIKVGGNDRDIHDYAPLYLNPKNPMLYARRELHESLIILKINRGVLQNEHLFTDGNAASRNTKFSNDETIVESCIDALIDPYWDNHEDGKRKRCAEVLIYPSVQSKFIDEVICSNQDLANELKHISPFKVTVDKSIFFK